MQLEIRHLRMLCAVADAGSISKAAAALGISQPALTAQLRRIEVLVGGDLFARARSGVHPTDLGESVLGAARAVLADMDFLLSLVADRTRRRSHGRAMVVGGFAGAMVPTLAGVLSEEFPELTFSTH